MNFCFECVHWNAHGRTEVVGHCPWHGDREFIEEACVDFFSTDELFKPLYGKKEKKNGDEKQSRCV